MVTDAGANARPAVAIKRNGLEATKGIHIRLLKRRDASRAEAAEAKCSIEAVSCQMHEHAKACTPTDQSVRDFKDVLGINTAIKLASHFRTVICRYAYSSTSLERGLRRVVPAALATTQAKPHAQQ